MIKIDVLVRDKNWRKYVPNPGFTGKDKIEFTLSDGVNSSDQKTIYITVK